MKKVISLISILTVMSLAVMSLAACSNKTEGSEGSMPSVLAEQESTEVKQETETVEEDKAIELYINVLRNYISEGRTDFSVSFIELDDDSTSEMVVFFGEAHIDGGYLFTIKNEEAIRVVSEGYDNFGEYGGFTYKEKGNVFVAEHVAIADTQISDQICYYTMENGKAVCKDVAESIIQMESDDKKFYVNDTEVDSEQFNHIEENYGLSEMSTVSYSSGVHVVNEQMEMVYNAYHNR